MSKTVNHREKLEKEIIEKALADTSFKQCLMNNPSKAISEVMGISIPEGISIEVLEEKPNRLYLVLPVDKSELEIPEEILKNIKGAAAFCSNCW